MRPSWSPPTEFINAMRAYMEKNLGMPTDLSLADARTMVGIYYSMRTVGFSNQATYTLADNVPMDLIAYIKESTARIFRALKSRAKPSASTTPPPPRTCSARSAP